MTDQSFITVKEVMTPDPVTIDGLANIHKALNLMETHKISALVIDRRYEGDEYGMITVKDIAEKIIGANRSIDRSSVYEIMTKPVLTLSSGMDIKYAIRLLSRFSLSRALVTELGVMVGIVSLRDMTVRFIRADAKKNSSG
jgi:predicted transcriptional regulator